MKNLIWLKKTVLILVLASFTVACSDDDEVSAQGTTITDLAIASPALSNLVAALTAADGDLPAVLKGAGPYTVLAPTNAAFETFLDGRALEDIPSEVLTQVLLNHVLNGKVEAADLTGLNADGIFYASTLATGAKANTQMSIYFETEGGVEFNGYSNVVDPNIQASNGVIHVVDAVIDLPTVVDFALADDRFSTLVSALTADDSFGYVAALQTANGTNPAPFTVFAPTNDAFAALLVDLEVTGLISIPIPTLQTVLELHVVPGTNVLSSELAGLDGQAVPSLGGSNITIQASPAGIIGPGNDTTLNPIVIADVQASNGVIHALSRVIR
ncbi:fasciclin domain-containing protein [Cellulophaga sp. Hel_I_12]|uniref:fasciclin domain-containing protein n=1 Tax=Cellulophaga sp. Hel_I_12 TaxID=1249972 RepID=UPI000645B4FF|nr:fasciclin domain-containing protein [Cellulophaga sp. Hel_I_12]